MTKPKTQPAELDEDVEDPVIEDGDDEDEDQAKYDDEAPLFDPEEAGR